MLPALSVPLQSWSLSSSLAYYWTRWWERQRLLTFRALLRPRRGDWHPGRNSLFPNIVWPRLHYISQHSSDWNGTSTLLDSLTSPSRPAFLSVEHPVVGMAGTRMAGTSTESSIKLHKRGWRTEWLGKRSTLTLPTWKITSQHVSAVMEELLAT